MFDILSPTGIQDLIQAYGLWVLFAVVMLESMAVPMPGETALVTAALYAGSTHRIGILPVVIVAATAAVGFPPRSDSFCASRRVIASVGPPGA